MNTLILVVKIFFLFFKEKISIWRWFGFCFLVLPSLSSGYEPVKGATLVDAGPARYEVKGDIFIDRVSGLKWTRCLVALSGDRCDGEAKLVSYPEALKLAEEYEVSGLEAWRIPSLDEIKSISSKPKLPGQSWLSNAPFGRDFRGFFWSSTQSKSYHRQYWAFDSGDGTSGKYIEKMRFFLILVHD